MSQNHREIPAMTAFPEIDRISYEGAASKNPLAFRHYNADELVEGRSMRDHLRFSVVYWHTFRGTGSDPFGPGTAVRPWERTRTLARITAVPC
jgi:xylose isomerase